MDLDLIKNDKKILIDTNILIYISNDFSPWHSLALTSVEFKLRQGYQCFISTQILREYLCAASRPVEGRTPPIQDILLAVDSFIKEFQVVDDTLLVFHSLQKLLSEIPVSGKKIHDANIVATMQFYGIPCLLTFNVSDFRRFSDIIQVFTLSP